MENRFTEEMVNELADKLYIGLNEEENMMVLSEFNDIDMGISRITAIEGLENIEPMTHCLDEFVYELREDEAEESLDIDELLSNCDDYIDTEVKVPKVVG